jgi:hypothetical protein
VSAQKPAAVAEGALSAALACAQGGLTSAIFDETFGVLLYAAGRYNHLELEHGVFTARLEVDYKKVRAAAAAAAAGATCSALG